MSFFKSYTVSVTTDSGGDATAYTTGNASGRIHAIAYVDTDLDAGADLTVTTNTTGQAVLTKANFGGTDAIWYPRTQVHDSADGSVLTLDGTRKNVDYTVAAEETIKLVIAQGGNAKSATFYVIVGG